MFIAKIYGYYCFILTFDRKEKRRAKFNFFLSHLHIYKTSITVFKKVEGKRRWIILLTEYPQFKIHDQRKAVTVSLSFISENWRQSNIFRVINKKQRNKRQGNEATSANNVILSLIISLRRRMKYLYAEFNSQR